MGGCQEDGASVFSVVPGEKTGGSRHELKYGTFCLNIRKHFFTVKMVKCWHRLPSEFVESPSWRYSKSNWTWSWGTCFEQWVGLGDLQRCLLGLAIL